MAKPKGINKLKVGFSIDISLNYLLDKYCNDRSINKSKLISKIVKDFLDSKEIEYEKRND